MFESKYNKLLTGILIFIIIAIIGLLVFLGIQYWSTSSNTQEAEDFVDSYVGDESISSIKDDIPTTNEETKDESEENDEEKSKPLEVGESVSSTTTTTKTKKKTYNGFTVNGTMEIPKINFKYPVLEKVSKSAIENSVAILYGAGLNQVGNTVIIGHNYRNGQFFSNNKKLENGDKIYITDYEGVKKTYTIYHHFVTTPDDTSFYQRDTNGKAEVTLSTCTDDSSGRLIILAKED